MNIANRISETSKRIPEKKSVVFSERQSDGSYKYPFYTFKQFEERSNQFANKFTKAGIVPGMRVLLFVRPCLDFSIITFALFKIGAIPVLIDPGMGIKNLLTSIKQVRPEGMISVGLVHWIRRLRPSFFKSIKIKLSLQNVGFSTLSIYEGLENEDKSFPIYPAKDEDFSAILFTSGGTGIPKGVLYTHGILNAQTTALQKMFSLDESQSDLPGFPLFALFTLAMGMTSVVPDMDPTKPALCDPKKLVQNILDNQITFVAGSPSIWEKVGKYCLENKIKLPSVKQVVMFGAPVRSSIHEMFQKILVNGDTFTPYGATESLPISLISGSDILGIKSQQTNSGAGTCVGKAVPGIEIKIIKTSDIPELHLSELKNEEIGEIVVSGLQVTHGYFEMSAENLKSKIIENGKTWHRVGDMGYLDHDQNLWFLGRKTHRVVVNESTTHYPIRVEAIFNQHPEIKRTALIQILKNGIVSPALVIEMFDGQKNMESKFLDNLKLLARSSQHTQMIQDFYLHPAFPVDVRHNIKIDRTKLSVWAQNQKKYTI
jgi:acyl-CoA synthetase (AMP-forming)/AMP-acid ligase II